MIGPFVSDVLSIAYWIAVVIIGTFAAVYLLALIFPRRKGPDVRTVPVWLFLKHDTDPCSTTRAPAPERVEQMKADGWRVLRADVLVPRGFETAADSVVVRTSE